jgi:heat shock protein HtpX
VNMMGSVGPELPPAGRSIVWRAALALGLMVGFYALAAGIAGALVFVPYAEWHYGNRLHLKLAAFCLIGAFLILKALLPRWDTFEAPGPALTPQAHPRLFAELRRIAEATGQNMPAEVFLVPDVNAWVAQRGGIMGMGSRRVMGLGLPLLAALRLSEFRAVIAHEFGHYHGGDVKLGPWIYKTRSALVRTVRSLSEHSGALSKPFEWYGALFFRITHAVSRRQELEADALAARVAGAAALAGGLRAAERAGVAFQPYWTSEVAPVLNAGFRPPLLGGFDVFVKQPKVARQLETVVLSEEREGRHDPYDTHPSLRERIAAVGNPPASPPGDDDVAATTLLEDAQALEAELMGSLAVADQGARLTPLAWDEVGSAVYLPSWRSFHRKHGRTLLGVRPGDLHGIDWDARGARVARSLEAQADADASGFAETAVGIALAVQLTQRGFSVEALPGGAVRLTKGDDVVEPFAIREHLSVEGGVTAWQQLCRRQGIADLDLGA